MHDGVPLPPPEILFEKAEDEALFQQVLTEFRKPPAAAAGNYWLLITILLFALAQNFWGEGGTNLPWLATLVGVIFLHELGHYLGMVAFGYRDVRMFFIPLFGAAVTGRKHAAPAWQQLIVLLLGPLPGILLAGILYAFTRPVPSPFVRDAITLLLALNAFNLLPLVPFDGGRVANILIFSRSPLLEAIFSVGAGLGLIALGFSLDAWFLYVLAVLVFIPINIQYRLRTQAREVLEEIPDLPAELADLRADEVRSLFWRVHSAIPQMTNVKQLASSMRSVHEIAVTPPPGVLGTLGFVALHGAGFVVTLAILVWMVWDRPPGEQATSPTQRAAELVPAMRATRQAV